MNNIDREGIFRFEIVEEGVGTTKNGFPQWIARLKAVEMFNPEDDTWVDWSEYDQTIVAYICLFNNDGPIFNYENLQRALGWDGSSFSDLKGHEGQKIMGWVEENDYNGTVRLQVQTVDAPDASPMRSLRVIEGDALTDLDAKFGDMMKAKTKTAAKAPAKPAAKKADPPKKAAKPAPTPAAKTPPPSTKKSVPDSKTSSTTSDEPASMTKDEAWAGLHAIKGDAGDEAVTSAWLDAVSAVMGDRTEDDMTNEDWGAVHTMAEAELAAFA